MITSGITASRDQIVATIRTTAEASGVDFSYLVKQAQVESGLNPNARAGTSSAAGLFQFTSGTWLKMVERHGETHGLGAEAAALRSGSASKSDVAKLLEKRHDPELSTRLAAQFAIENAQSLVASGVKQVGPTELYLAHFLGAGGSAKFLQEMEKNPNAPAAPAMRSAADANRPIFYAKGEPVSYRAIYDRFAKKFDISASVSPVIAKISADALERSKMARAEPMIPSIDDLMSKKTPTDLVAKRPTDQDLVSILGKSPEKSQSVQPQTLRARSSAPFMIARPEAAAAPVDLPAVNAASMAKFLESASQWQTEPGLAPPDNGMAGRDASQGARSQG
jgi:hypothetical protein